MLKRARRYSPNFDRYIRVDGNKIKEMKPGVRRQLRRRLNNEYLYRIQLKRPRPGAFEIGDQVDWWGRGLSGDCNSSGRDPGPSRLAIR